MSLSQADEQMRTALAHHKAGRAVEAEAAYRQVLAIAPAHADALHYLGILLFQKGQAPQGWDLVKQAIALRPQLPHYWCNAAPILLALGMTDDAIQACRRALSLRPEYCEAYYFLGLAHRYKGEFEESLPCYRKAVECKPDHAEAWNAMGVRLREKGELDEAMECYRRALAINPNFVDAHNNIGVVFRDAGQLDEALESHRRALRLEPRNAKIRSNIATVLKDMGEVVQAIREYREALTQAPDARIGSNLLYALLFREETTPAELREEHQRWNETYAKPLSGSICPHENDPDPNRRLRIGYISPDFRVHPIGRFLFPLLVNQDQQRFEVFCYSDVRRPDAITVKLKTKASAWRETRGQSDEHVTDLIRQDRIDILVDLTMHMENNRMLVFARKPAPVQVTYLAYAGTTGLETMDYRLTDLQLDPIEREEPLYSEKSLRLRSYWCYQPSPDAPGVVPPPCLSAGHVTFGCMNNFCKMTPGTFNSSCELLRRVAKSRLILHARQGSHRQRTAERFAANGINPARVEFVDSLPTLEYLAQYQRIDIALDPFPYPGGTTTCDVLWMGVPVITFPRESAISRGGLSILSNLRLKELVARDPEHYVCIASELAEDHNRLKSLRTTMRERMQNSVLMDISGYRRDVESTLRRAWHEWCFENRR